MSKDAKNVPALRFKGYSDAWEKRKFKDLVVRVNKTSDDSTIPSVEFEDIISKQGRLNKDVRLKINSKQGIYFEPQDVLFGKLRPYLQNWLFPSFYGRAVGDFWVLRANSSVLSEYLFVLIQSPRFQIVANISSGTKMPRSDWNTVSNTSFPIPVQSEQRKIWQLFNVLDNLIAATQHNIDALEQAKKALLQRLFDQSWRFKGYSDPWEKRKLGEVATITMGQSPDSKNYTLNPQDHILVQGNADIKNGWVEPRVWTTQITKIAKKGSVLLSVRAPVGEVSKTAFDVVLGRGVASVGQTDFLYQYLITLKINGFWLRYSTGSTFDSINSADIKDAIIFLPEKNEQSRIAKTLNCIDNLIAATQSRLSSLELLKKALLQDLFI
ncbi:restriction endonuclease subunit S [Lacticaseibacillus paracasei]|uniref:restriction endonuclease subunit S n=1 Tax=Lacticaseibacillus paracasei TaxID=1597 RepID=UPI004045F152